ncbi:MAG: hypothetical protein ABIJ30_01630 [bacterium]
MGKLQTDEIPAFAGMTIFQTFNRDAAVVTCCMSDIVAATLVVAY